LLLLWLLVLWPIEVNWIELFDASLFNLCVSRVAAGEGDNKSLSSPEGEEGIKGGSRPRDERDRLTMGRGGGEEGGNCIILNKKKKKKYYDLFCQ
jgi:hypothetical protein